VRHIDTFFDDPYLRAGHLQGEVMTVTMRRVVQEIVGKEEDKCPVLYFDEFSKGMVLNKTNAKRIMALYSGDTDEWPGKRILIYPTETEFGGDTVECIRVKREPPAPA